MIAPPPSYVREAQSLREPQNHGALNQTSQQVGEQTQPTVEAGPENVPEAVEPGPTAPEAGADGDVEQTRMPHASWSEDAGMAAQQQSALDYHNQAQEYLDSINQDHEGENQPEAPQPQTSEPSPEPSSLRGDAEAALQQEEAERAAEVEHDKERDYEFEP